MCGWLSAARSCASSTNRLLPAAPSRSRRMTLSATDRPSITSRARTMHLAADAPSVGRRRGSGGPGGGRGGEVELGEVEAVVAVGLAHSTTVAHYGAWAMPRN